MQITFQKSTLDSIQADVAVVIMFEAEGAGSREPAFVAQDGWFDELRSSGEFTGKLFEKALLYRPAGFAARRLALIGGGKREKFSAVEARRIAGLAARWLKPKGVRTVLFHVDEDLSSPELLVAVAEGALLGNWEADKYKTDAQRNEKSIETFTIVSKAGDETDVQRGVIIAESQNLARDLINEPSNKLVPADLAAAAKTMADAEGLECRILETDEMAKLGMGALLGVAQGSSNPPFLIVLSYKPHQAAGQDHLALVGKGVTFDTGGLSIKPSEGMERMKYDMAGAAAVIGAMRAIARLKPSIPVTGYIPTVENMINGNAQRPGDIVTTLSGKTVEVLNTDAEGRLILADALTYANRQGATHIVDAATLTGAIGVALGHHNMGAFTNNESLLGRFNIAAKSAGEKVWQLPMDEEYKDYLKSAFADLPNIGGRYGGSITAAWFLREFADPTPWLHLDIASTAWLDDSKPYLSKGPSGVAVRSFVELATGWSSTTSS